MSVFLYNCISYDEILIYAETLDDLKARQKGSKVNEENRCEVAPVMRATSVVVDSCSRTTLGHSSSTTEASRDNNTQTIDNNTTTIETLSTSRMLRHQRESILHHLLPTSRREAFSRWIQIYI